MNNINLVRKKIEVLKKRSWAGD